MKIYFAGDHAGFEMKQKLMEFVRSLEHEVEDMGPTSYVAGDDYPDFVIPLAIRIAKARNEAERSQHGTDAEMEKKGEMGKRGERGVGEMGERGERGTEVRGIVVAGSGQGEIIAMNRVKGARAALLCPGPKMTDLIKASRDHNDSNIFVVGARFCTLDEAKKGIKLWLETPFSGGERHIRRLAKIEDLTGC